MGNLKNANTKKLNKKTINLNYSYKKELKSRERERERERERILTVFMWKKIYGLNGINDIKLIQNKMGGGVGGKSQNIRKRKWNEV